MLLAKIASTTLTFADVHFICHLVLFAILNYIFSAAVLLFEQREINVIIRSFHTVLLC